jgi:parallel beta-helix repeat protein
MQKRVIILLVLALPVPTVQVAADPVSVRDYGAKGNDSADDTGAFVAALRASRNVYVPEGVYRIGTVELPDQTWFHGDGRASVIRFVPGKHGKAAINVGTSCRVSNLRFTGTEPFENWITGKASMEPVMLLAQGRQDIEIDRVQIDDFRHNGIWLEGCEDVRIANCVLEKLFQGMEIDNCKRVHVTGNRLREMRNHGIQFWGQSNFTKMLCEDLIFANNYVFHGGSGAIWGTGARRVVMSGNIVDGAKDIGLDLEWCYDCTITGNTTKNCWNAGIALFLSCRNVSISGNSVFIDDGEEGRRDGIWLTGVNRGLYRKDFGHRQISITGNTIHAEGRQRHGISIGSGYDVVCAANTMRNADVLDRTGRARLFDPQGASNGPVDSLAGVTVVPLGPEWRFATDPNDEGVTNRWFDPGFGDANWATIRSDRVGIGWEGQGFGGKDGKGYVGFAWYRAHLPKLPAKRLRFAYLHFGMTDEQAWVYVSGKQVGEHSVESEGKPMHTIWDEPFGVEITEYLEEGDPPALALRIHNAALTGGLRRPASLILSDVPISVTQQIRAAAAWHRQRVLRRAVKWPELLGTVTFA